MSQVARFAYCIVLIVCALMCAPASQAATPPAVTQVVTVTNRIVDQLGYYLPGTDPAAAAFGHPSAIGDVVQILQAVDGVIRPPDRLGAPDPLNVVVQETRIGAGVSPAEGQPARFATALTPRPAGNTILFVRVFNAGYVPDATFYKDSQTFTVSSAAAADFVANIAKVDVPLDPADSDGDGLCNSMEKDYGSDPLSADGDGDGMTDWEEFHAGTLTAEEDSCFALTEIRSWSAQDLLLSWDTVKDRLYTIERAAGDRVAQPAFEYVNTVVGTGTRLEVLVPSGSAESARHYRVSVRRPAAPSEG